MKTGSFFTIGSTHNVCEDYALHGSNYAILSDGCSSSPHTDWGSRILCKAAEANLDLLRDPGLIRGLGSITFAATLSAFYDRIMGVATTQVAGFPNLPRDCLTATLLTICESGDYILGCAMGDGMIAGRKRDGSWEVREFQYEPNAPYYPLYEWDRQQKTSYFNTFNPAVSDQWFEGSVKTGFEATINHPVDMLNFREIPYFVHMFPKNEYDLVLISSDGLSSFCESGRMVSIPFQEVLPLLFDFRGSFNETFLQRQCKWCFKKNGDFSKRNWVHSDDVSVGGIYCD